MADGAVCNVCGIKSELKCSQCHEVHYCSREHQKADWKKHRPNCASYKVVQDENIGRHLVATRAISEGEVILKEEPLVTGPPQVTPPICLGCYKLLNNFNKLDCRKCGWPVCSDVCEKSRDHVPECEITANYKKSKVKINTFVEELPHPSYQCLIVLRCLYMKKSNPDIWKKLNDLQSHSEERKETAKYEADRFFTAKFIPEFFNYSDFSEEEILRIAGIVQINAHEIPLRDPGYVGIYEKASLLEHSCRANCSKIFTNSGQLVIRAAGKIAPGEHLSICYTYPLWDRHSRLNHLCESKFFLCRCVRCLDPTELGTHFNSVKCFRECSGYCIPTIENDDSSEQKVESKTHWKCQKCGDSPGDLADTLLSEMKVSIYKLNKKSRVSCENFLNKYEKSVHPNNHLVVNVKLALIDIITGQSKIDVEDDKSIQWSIKTCRDMYSLVNKLVPAENRLRGVLLYQLYLGLMENGRRKAARLEFDFDQVRENLTECQNVLKLGYKLLSSEPDKLPEGKMAVEMKKALKNIEQFLQQPTQQRLS